MFTVSKKPNISNIVGYMHASELIPTCHMCFFRKIGQYHEDQFPVNQKLKTRGRKTHARENEGPSLSVANHVLNLILKPVDPRFWPGD